MSELSIIDIVKILMKRIWLIIGCIILCAAIGYVYCTMFAVPKYMATASLYGSNNSKTDTPTQTDIVTAQLAVDTYVVLLKSNSTMEKVLEDTGLNYTRDELIDMIDFSISNDTSVVNVNVTSENRNDAISIANSLVNLAPNIIESFFTNDNTVSETSSNFMKVIDLADTTEQVSPRTVLTTALSGFIGAACAVLFVLALAVMDKTIKDEQDILDHYNVVVLGAVPDFDAPNKGGRY